MCAKGLSTRAWQTAVGRGVSTLTSAEDASRARTHGENAKRTRAPEEQRRRSFERLPRVLAAAAPPRLCAGGSADSGPQRTGICSAARRQEPADRRLQAGQCRAGGLPPTRTQNALGSGAEPRPLLRPQTPGTTSARPAGDLHPDAKHMQGHPYNSRWANRHAWHRTQHTHGATPHLAEFGCAAQPHQVLHGTCWWPPAEAHAGSPPGVRPRPEAAPPPALSPRWH